MPRAMRAASLHHIALPCPCVTPLVVYAISIGSCKNMKYDQSGATDAPRSEKLLLGHTYTELAMILVLVLDNKRDCQRIFTDLHDMAD